jgi:hypothetical protein
MVDLESCGSGYSIECTIHQRFNLHWQFDVNDRAAEVTDEMVMVSGEFLRELPARMITAMNEASHHADLGEDGQVAVGRTLCEPIASSEQLGQGRWASIGEQFDQTTTVAGVELASLPQPSSHETVKATEVIIAHG